MKTAPVQNAFVTGGGSGMGRAIAFKLAEMGIDVSVADIDKNSVEATAAELADRGITSRAFHIDVSRSDQVARAFVALKDESSRLDLLVHAAGILGRTAFIDELDDGEWRQMMAVNLDGTFYCTREASRWMKEQKSGRIVLFSSIASLMPSPGALHYAVTKSGVNMLGRTLAKELAKYNIRVNVVAPGYVETPLLEGLPEGFEEYVVKKTPLKRLGTVDEVAGLVAFLASPDADFITGQVLSPNGGMVI